MSFNATAHIIQFILAPVVMVSACAILISGMLTQYGAINDRLRAMGRERLELLRALAPASREGTDTTEKLTRERLGQIDAQLPDLLHRHDLVHAAVLLCYCTILCLVASMFVIAVAVVTDSTFAGMAALLFFLGGTGVLLVGVGRMAMEIRTSNRAITYETTRIIQLAG
jgi:hypothetical protein